jgi:hypothetical protein
MKRVWTVENDNCGLHRNKNGPCYILSREKLHIQSTDAQMRFKAVPMSLYLI